MIRRLVIAALTPFCMAADWWLTRQQNRLNGDGDE